MEKRRYIPILGVTAALALMTSCVKDTLYSTPHPDKGTVAITVQELSSGIDYVAEIDGESADITGSPFVFPGVFNPGPYSLVIYSRVEGFTFEGGTAQVNYLDGKAQTDGTAIIPLPGYLKSVSQEITVTADDTLRVNATPVQHVRDLQIELTITQGAPELIQSVTGTLSGIAGSFDMGTGQTTGEPVSTVFSFTRNGNILTADVRLLGTMGAVQTLVLDIVFTDGGRTQRTESDLTEYLANFDSDMTTAYSIKGVLETPVGMEGCNAIITDWSPEDGGNVNVEL